jgi:hypothetical protein
MAHVPVEGAACEKLPPSDTMTTAHPHLHLHCVGSGNRPRHRNCQPRSGDVASLAIRARVTGHFHRGLESLYDHVLPETRPIHNQVAEPEFMKNLQKVKAELNDGSLEVGPSQ